MSKFWKPNITHVIVATDEEGASTRTLKVLMAILNGRWVLKIDCKLILDDISIKKEKENKVDTQYILFFLSIDCFLILPSLLFDKLEVEYVCSYVHLLLE